MNKAIAEHDNVKRDLHDNLELKRIQKRIIEKEKELNILQRHEDEVDFVQIVEKRASIANKIQNMINGKVGVEGEMRQKTKIIDSINKELQLPQYKDSARNFKKAYYENYVLTKIIDDLNTYCETLEKALTNFHADKMAKINRLIIDLWRSIYKGNDIDYIKINTEETKGTSKKRSYTYRVVASKNDSLMDFRGQSSAGQRVLACLIIRIALAETFGGTCGVLALDEPTTNLDHHNIESLCEALNKLVEEREIQSNFMLIVITHDEQFIRTLGRVTSYWRVSRDQLTTKSKLEKLRVS